VRIIYLFLVFLFGLNFYGLPSSAKKLTGAIVSSGVQRTFVYNVPFNSRANLPLVIAFHGAKGDGEHMAGLSQFDPLSERENFIVVYPDGINKEWNDGRLLGDAKAKDVQFTLDLIRYFETNFRINTNKVYAVGMSNGALFSYRLACEIPNKIAGIGVVAGSMNLNLASHCSPSKPVPVIAFNGTEDTFIPYKGGNIVAKRGRVIPVEQAIGFWAKVNHCLLPPIKQKVAVPTPKDRTGIISTIYRGGSHRVVLYTIINGGHTWPGGTPYLPERIVGATTKHINASKLIWEFFERNTREAIE